MKILKKTFLTPFILFGITSLGYGQFIPNPGKTYTIDHNSESCRLCKRPTSVNNSDKPSIKEKITELHFDLNKYTISTEMEKTLDSMIVILNKDQEMHIEVEAHSDSRASEDYNLVLSQKRSKAISGYLVSKGINSERIILKNYGEIALLNNCDDFVVCTEELQKQNRRVELRIVYPTIESAQEAKTGTYPEITYHVQLITSKINPADVRTRINGTQTIFLQYHADGSYTYYSGLFSQRADAELHQKELLKKGLKGFVVAFSNEGRVVSR